MESTDPSVFSGFSFPRLAGEEGGQAGAALPQAALKISVSR